MFYSVFFVVLFNGLVVVCSLVGFGSLIVFVVLYFDSLGWNNVVYCLSVFGIVFICVRLVLFNVLLCFGGYWVVVFCLIV